MRIDIWSDVVCPWCYLGKRRLERALARSTHGSDAEIVWRSFQLDPRVPKGSRQPHAEYLARRTGRTIDEVRASRQRLVELAAAEGLAYDFDRYVVANTRDAHRVAHLAASQGLGPAMAERLFKAQLEEGEALDDPATLVRLGGEVGVPTEAVESVLGSDAYDAAVDEDIRTGASLGVTGVPFFVFERAYGLSGAQPVEVFEQALELAGSGRDAGLAEPPEAQ
jgi:predicted DsbA family dithiol-disulfide isomerase